MLKEAARLISTERQFKLNEEESCADESCCFGFFCSYLAFPLVC